MEEKKEERFELSGRKKGVVYNPHGRPKGSITKSKSQKVEDRLRYKHKRHPVDELIKIVDSLYMKGKYEEAGEIWLTLLKYMEPAKRPVEAKEEKTSPAESLKAAENAFDLLKELEKEHNAIPGTEGKGNTPSLDGRPINLQADAGTETDLQDGKGK